MLQISWVFDKGKVDQFATFFSRNITVEYISHSELQGPRTTSTGEWTSNLAEVFQAEILDATTSDALSKKENKFTRNVCAAFKGNVLLGLGYVSVSRGRLKSYATIEDIVVDKNSRGEDIGGQLVSWIIQELENMGVHKIFLESGIHNDKAHHFFERFGFHKCSLVMTR
jgi:ribosomal protein S18 acetylase RimI-like enzyme